MKLSILANAFLLIIVMALSISMLVPKPEPYCDRLHCDGKLQSWEVNGIVPDEETAIKIADAIIKTQSKVISEWFGDNQGFNADVSFNEQKNQWELVYYQTPQKGMGGDIIIHIMRDCGMVTEFGFTK